MNSNELDYFPEFLRSYEKMVAHFDEQIGDLPDTKKGEAFENFVMNIIPYSSLGDEFQTPRRSKKDHGHQSRDGGADLVSEGFNESENKYLFIQLLVDALKKISIRH